MMPSRRSLVLACSAKHGRFGTEFTVTIRRICATQPLNSGAAATMSRRVKKPLRPAGDRPKGARPYRGSAAERPQSYRPGGKPPARFPASPPRAAKPFVPEPEKVVPEPPPLPTKVQTVVVTADENNMRVDRFLEARFPGAFVLPHPAHRPQGRAARQRQARRQQGPAGGRPERSHSAAQARYAEGRGPALGSCDQDAASHQGHDPL